MHSCIIKFKQESFNLQPVIDDPESDGLSNHHIGQIQNEIITITSGSNTQNLSTVFFYVNNQKN